MQRSNAKKSTDETGRYLKLCDDVSLKRLEEFYAYNKKSDELYEIDEKACRFLKSCTGSNKINIKDGDNEFIDYCINEGILNDLGVSGDKRDIIIFSSDLKPSLRYLELLVTDKCNLKCRHCYLKNCGKSELNIKIIKDVFSEFESNGGLRLIVSGGEPLLHSDFKAINELLTDYSFRSILLTNGTLLNKYIINELNFDEVQISIDGLEETHDLIRGAGTYEKALNAVKLVKKSGIDISVATMALKNNIDELKEIESLMHGLGVKRWEVDVPCATVDDDIFLDYDSAGKAFKYGFSSGLYNSADGYACGAHLMTVMNDGRVSKCSFFADESVGKVRDGLINNFKKIKKIMLNELECDCDFIKECRGGCRYRASSNGGINKKDIAKCGFYL